MIGRFLRWLRGNGEMAERRVTQRAAHRQIRAMRRTTRLLYAAMQAQDRMAIGVERRRHDYGRVPDRRSG